MRQSDLAIYIYLVTQSGYLGLATKVAWGIGIIDGKILSCQGISEESVDNKTSL